MSINLHKVVRSAINAVHADESGHIVRSIGSSNDHGRIVTQYASAVAISFQVQTLSGDDLRIMAETERTERDRKFYLFSDPLPAGQIRTLARTGDYIRRAADGSVWKIYNVAEDFTGAGWVQVLAAEQTAESVPPAVRGLFAEVAQ